MAACQDNGDAEIPQWKRELILRRRALARTLPAGSSSVLFTCPTAVAAVRQADTAAGENSPTSSVIHSSASVDATAEDFHVGGGGRAVASSLGENMRLVEHETTASGIRRPLKNGVGYDSNNSVDAVKYRSIMGEEKSGKKSSVSRKMESNNVKSVNLILGENNNGSSHPRQDDGLSDSSEELQYGPGIVKKLKSKYMSMTLRESKNKGVRPSLSQLRRATSLENMIDNEENETGKPQLIKPQHKFTKRTEVIAAKSGYAAQHQQRYRSSNRGNDSIKRARSVEALLRYDVKPAIGQAPQPPPIEKKLLLKSLSKDEIIIFDKTGAVINEEKPPVPQSTLTRKKRPIMSQKHGLPPADLVKQTLKLFEKSATAKVNGPPPPMAKLNINAANQHKPVSNKPLLSPKPSPEKIRRNPMSIIHSPKKTAAPSAPVTAPATVPSPPVADTQRTQSPVTKESPECEAKRLPTVPSRVLPLDLKPVMSASTLSSPKSKSPSPMSHITVKTILTPTNGVSRTPPYVKPRTPSPGPLSPTSENAVRSTSPVKATRSPSPVKATSVTSPIKASSVPSPLTQPPVPSYTTPKLPSPVVQQPPTSVPTPKLPSPVVQTPTIVSPKLPSPTGQPQTTSVVSPKTPSPVFKPPRSSSPVVTTRTPSPSSKPATVSPTPVSNGKLPMSTDDKSSDEDDNDGVSNKKVTVTALENIRKSGSSVEFSFCGTSAKPSVTPVSSAPKPVSRPAPLPITTPSPAARHPTPMSPLPSIKSPDALTNKKQVGVIRPIVNKFMQPPSSLTDREIEKNQINRVKSNPTSTTEQPTKVVVSVKPSEIVVGNVADSFGLKGRDDAKVKSGAGKSNGPGLWDNKWNQQNTMIFDFRNRAEPVPDYIENDGIILRMKREKIKPGDSGFILLDPSLEESSTDCETDDFNCGGFLGPPSPCNVRFEGDNILINGKSSLRKHPKQRKLRITFNDNATERFEYPSESSMLNDMLNSASSSSGGLPVPSASAGPTPGLPVPSGGSSLASYTSRTSQGAEDFQLGVSRTTPQPKPREPDVGTAEAAAANGEADNVAWSADTADDLLF